MTTEIELTGAQLENAGWNLEDGDEQKTFGFRVNHQEKKVENYLIGSEEAGSMFDVDYEQFLLDFPLEVANANEELGFTWND